MKRTVLLCMMMFGVLYAQSPQAADTPENTAAKKTVRTVVSDISVHASEKTITLNWKLAPDVIPHIKELLIFRSTERISSIQEDRKAAAIFQAPDAPPLPEVPGVTEVSSAGLKAEKTDKNILLIKTVPPETTEYTDSDTEPGKAYYYAVAARKKNGTVYGFISPGLNASFTAVSLKDTNDSRQKRKEHTASKKPEKAESVSPIPIKTADPMRKKPLPALKIFPETPPARIQKTSEQTKKKAENAIRNGGGNPEKEADILPPDTSDKEMIGDDYSLFVIVDSFVKTKKWPEAQAELKRFLQINRTEEAAARAYFYLGQSLYFNGNYREALACFQKSCVLYPVLSKRWITETLDAYRIEGHLID